jgi:hypothetical protein
MAAYDGLNNCLIFDFETLSQKPANGVVVSFAMINYSDQRFISMPYEYDELVEKAQFIKFNVADQVKSYNRKIEKSTLEWWDQQNEEAKKQLKPSGTDRSIADLYNFVVQNTHIHNLKRVYTRRNTFDPIFMSSIMEATGNPEPYDWWLVRDTISFIDGLTIGSDDIRNNFIPDGLKDKFVAHDPRHDIAMDIMRMQTLIQAVTAF